MTSHQTLPPRISPHSWTMPRRTAFVSRPSASFRCSVGAFARTARSMSSPGRLAGFLDRDSPRDGFKQHLSRYAAGDRDSLLATRHLQTSAMPTSRGGKAAASVRDGRLMDRRESPAVPNLPGRPREVRLVRPFRSRRSGRHGSGRSGNGWWPITFRFSWLQGACAGCPIRTLMMRRPTSLRALRDQLLEDFWTCLSGATKAATRSRERHWPSSREQRQARRVFLV